MQGASDYGHQTRSCKSLHNLISDMNSSQSVNCVIAKAAEGAHHRLAIALCTSVSSRLVGLPLSTFVETLSDLIVQWMR